MTGDARPKLAKKVRLRFDAREGKWMVLAPERGLFLNGSAKEIVDLCDGTRTEDELVRALAEAHGAPHDVVAKDVARVLSELRARVLLEPGT